MVVMCLHRYLHVVSQMFFVNGFMRYLPEMKGTVWSTSIVT